MEEKSCSGDKWYQSRWRKCDAAGFCREWHVTQQYSRTCLGIVFSKISRGRLSALSCSYVLLRNHLSCTNGTNEAVAVALLHLRYGELHGSYKCCVSFILSLLASLNLPKQGSEEVADKFFERFWKQLTNRREEEEGRVGNRACFLWYVAAATCIILKSIREVTFILSKWLLWTWLPQRRCSFHDGELLLFHCSSFR